MKLRSGSLAGLTGMLLLLAGCSSIRRPVPVGQLQPPYQVLVYANGSPVSDRPVTAGSREERAVTRWLKTHPTGWCFDLNSYAPGICIRGEGFTLNVLKTVCVLNYRLSPEDTTFVQVSRPIEEGDDLRVIFAEQFEDQSPVQGSRKTPPIRIDPRAR